MTETRFEELKRYVRFGDDDTTRLRLLAPLCEPHLVRIAQEFYERIREHEAAHAVFTGEEQIERLQKTLVVWMRRLLAGPHDESYFEDRTRVGRTHVRVGLPQRYVITAMALVRVALDRLAEDVAAGERQAVRESLGRALDLELAIMTETYYEDLAERLQHIDRAEHAERLGTLARNERLHVDAVDLAKLVLVGTDSEGRIALFNREAERVTGRRRDEVLGKDARELLPPSLHSTTGEALARFARGEETPPDEWLAPVVTLAGHERLVAWRLARLDASPHDEVVLIAAGQDVTEERRREERARRDEKLAAVGTLAAGLAHEIRNPLNGALLHVTYLERALKKDGASEEAHAAVKFVGEEIRRLSGLVKDFLVFARPTAPERRPTSIHALCRHAIELAATEATAAHAELAADLSTADVTMPLDAPKMEQVLLNLLHNAIDAVGATGGGKVTLRERRLPHGVQLEVEDDGPGLPAADAPVFDAFYTTKPAGTGLGLSIVHRIVTDHGGTVNVESRPRRTVFRVFLPMTSPAEK